MNKNKIKDLVDGIAIFIFLVSMFTPLLLKSNFSYCRLILAIVSFSCITIYLRKLKIKNFEKKKLLKYFNKLGTFFLSSQSLQQQRYY